MLTSQAMSDPVLRVLILLEEALPRSGRGVTIDYLFEGSKREGLVSENTSLKEFKKVFDIDRVIRTNCVGKVEIRDGEYYRLIDGIVEDTEQYIDWEAIRARRDESLKHLDEPLPEPDLPPVVDQPVGDDWIAGTGHTDPDITLAPTLETATEVNQLLDEVKHDLKQMEDKLPVPPEGVDVVSAPKFDPEEDKGYVPVTSGPELLDAAPQELSDTELDEVVEAAVEAPKPAISAPRGRGRSKK